MYSLLLVFISTTRNTYSKKNNLQDNESPNYGSLETCPMNKISTNIYWWDSKKIRKLLKM